MSNISFEENNFGEQSYVREREPTWIVRALLKVRWVESETKAYRIIVGAVVVVLIFSFFIFTRGGSNSPQSGEVPAGQIVP